MQIEEGKYYKSREGKRVGPIMATGESDWPFDGVTEGSDSAYYLPDGTCPYIGERDLIEEWVE